MNNNSSYLKMILIGARFTQVTTMRLNKGRQDIVFIDIRKKKSLNNLKFTMITTVIYSTYNITVLHTNLLLYTV